MIEQNQEERIKINRLNNEQVILEAGGFTIDIIDASMGGGFDIFIKDHAWIQVYGDHKKTPLIVINSDEFPSKLEIKQDEATWIKPKDVDRIFKNKYVKNAKA